LYPNLVLVAFPFILGCLTCRHQCERENDTENYGPKFAGNRNIKKNTTAEVNTLNIENKRRTSVTFFHTVTFIVRLMHSIIQNLEVKIYIV